jgi:NAD(P)-dependent dehydrogenase (short-subunit alcohol dehydrogenase family)
VPWKLTQRAETIRGLGALIAEKFAKEGCNVAVNYNASKERAEQVVEKISTEYKVKCIAIQGVGFVNETMRSMANNI